jgi:DNA glycosylase AlkZ-like
MAFLTAARIKTYRDRTFRLPANLRLKDKEQAVSFVAERGFIYFWPIKDILLPSLWTAVAGDRPVADAHDDPGHVTWGWKDSLLGARRWYYAKVLRQRATIISLEAVPYFYALSENYGSPEEDYLIQYEQGRMTQEARAVYEALLSQSPLDTVALRRASRLTSRESESRFSRALSTLQADFKILPVGVTEAGAWHYAFAYDLVHRHLPELLEQARFIQDRQARRQLVRLYFRSVGSAQLTDLTRLFGWTRPQAERAVDELTASGELVRGLEIKNQPGEWITLAELL